MRPYYEDQAVTIYHGDALRVLPECPRPDLLILDPPFNLWPAVPYVPAATVLAFTNHNNRATVERIYGQPRTEAIWHFPDAGRWVSHNLPQITHETILVYGALNDAYVGQEQSTAPQYHKQTHSVLSRTVTPRGAYRPRPRRALDSVLTVRQSTATALRGRWSKPVGLMWPLIEWAATGPYLLDPYMGAGTSLRVAKNLGMRAIGIDLDEGVCRLAARRLAQETLPVEVPPAGSQLAIDEAP
jgi:site-specific DNA-methyltransferase (adenine-specific)